MTLRTIKTTKINVKKEIFIERFLSTTEFVNE